MRCSGPPNLGGVSGWGKRTWLQRPPNLGGVSRWGQSRTQLMLPWCWWCAEGHSKFGWCDRGCWSRPPPVDFGQRACRCGGGARGGNPLRHLDAGWPSGFLQTRSGGCLWPQRLPVSSLPALPWEEEAFVTSKACLDLESMAPNRIVWVGPTSTWTWPPLGQFHWWGQNDGDEPNP